MTYQLFQETLLNGSSMINKVIKNSNIIITFAPDNTDYRQFKIDIASGAQLTDANNNVMTSEQANTFLATLP